MAMYQITLETDTRETLACYTGPCRDAALAHAIYGLATTLAYETGQSHIEAHAAICDEIARGDIVVDECTR